MAGKKTQDTDALAADIEKLSLGTTDKRKKHGPRSTKAKDAGQAAAGTGHDNQQVPGQRYLPPHQRKRFTDKAKTPGSMPLHFLKPSRKTTLAMPRDSSG